MTTFPHPFSEAGLMKIGDVLWSEMFCELTFKVAKRKDISSWCVVVKISRTLCKLLNSENIMPDRLEYVLHT